ncbi:MAG TPA: CHASE3 domain-containing protein [Caulobacterales bacterium]|nr:CHASE3 domain-containing protein [Caulobacterales bacterium]
MTVNVLGRRFPAAATYVTLLGAGLLLLLITVGAAFWVVDVQHRHYEAVRASYELRSQARRILIIMQDAETGQRGYLLTGNSDYLAPYSSARAQVEAELATLDRAGAAEPAVRDFASRLRRLCESKFAELDETVRLRRSGHNAQALTIMRTDLGLHLMDDLRDLVDDFLSMDRQTLNSELTAAEGASATLRLIVIAAAVLLLAIGALLVIAARSAMGELRASRDAAQDANQRLTREMNARQRAEAKILHMQKMEAIGQLTGGVAHDFNNMLAVITGALTLMQRRIEQGDYDIKRFIDGANDAASRAAVLVGRLLAFARRQPLSPSVINANQLVGGMSELLRRTLGEQVQIETVLAGGLWNVHADLSQLENAIVNICVNARDAMQERGGGKLTIETANAFLDEQYADLNPEVTPGQYVMIAITDTGVGMPAEVIGRAFEPFFTTKEMGKGTGLGLSHVHGFLKQSGGHVSVYSEVGVGTTVKLYLPRSQQAETQKFEEPKNTPLGDADTLILAVEDDERVRLMAVSSLRELGYRVIHADNGKRALEILGQQPDISLLFTDIVMPDMNGRMLADEARRRKPDVKVLFTTGYTQNAIVHNGVVDADASLLMKPYSLDQLARKVRAVLDAK